MRVAFVVLVMIHGIIHLFGFLKAFKLSQFKQLTLPISTGYGIIWLTAAILFIVFAILFLTNEYWWAFGLVAVTVSQVLLIIFWKDAKFGTILNVLILVTSVVGAIGWIFINYFRDNPPHTEL